MAARKDNQTKRPKPSKPRPQGGRSGEAAGMNDEIRAEIVTRLACFDRTMDIQADLKARGIDISHQAIGQYNPEHASFNKAKKWHELFFSTRERFLDEIAKVPIAHRAVRLRRLEATYEKEWDRGNTAAVRSTLEQAAKEVGNVFSNVSKVTGTVRTTPGAVVPDQTAEERKNMLIDRLTEALAQRPAKVDKKPTAH